MCDVGHCLVGLFVVYALNRGSLAKGTDMYFRHLMTASAFVVAFGIAAGASAQSIFDTPGVDPPGTDRPGGDYRHFDIKGSADDCRETCLKDSPCQAWTFVKRGVQGPSARCWLKNAVPAPHPNPCCTSGTRSVRID
jgi:hypothetical protein